MRIVKSIFLNCIIMLCFSSLSFSQNKTAVQKPALGNVELVITPKLGTLPFYFDSTYTTAAGEKYKITNLKFFLSSISLSSPLGIESPASSAASKNGVFLVNLTESNFNAGIGKQSFRTVFQMKEGEYSDLRFNVGLPRQLNHSDPTNAEPPLDLGKADMFWSWNTGYIFLLIEGKLIGMPDDIFHFAIGGDINIMPISFGNLFNVEPLIEIKKDKTTRIELAFDLHTMFINGDGTNYSFKKEGASIVHSGLFAQVLRNNALKSFQFVSAGIID